MLVSKQKLQDLLQRMLGVVERKQTLPILSHVLLKTVKQDIVLRATDLELDLEATLPCADKITDPVYCTLPARKLFDICRALADETADILLSVENHKVSIKAEKSRFSLASLNPVEFPSLPEEAKTLLTIAVMPRLLKEMIERVQFAMAVQDVRYYLNGVLLRIKNSKLTLVASDGHRLAVAETPLQGVKVSEEREVILPRKAVQEISKLLDENQEEPVQIALKEKQVEVKFDTITLTTRLIDGLYPEYEHILPKGKSYSLEMANQQLEQSLLRVAILTHEKYRSVRLRAYDNTLSLQADNAEQEQAETQESVRYQGQEIKVAFNVHYLLDMLRVLKAENVTLNFFEGAQNLLVEESSEAIKSMFVVMPMRM